jgi:hypothetical protein
LKQGVTRLIVFRIRQFRNMDGLIVRDGANMNRGSRLSMELLLRNTSCSAYQTAHSKVCLIIREERAVI